MYQLTPVLKRIIIANLIVYFLLQRIELFDYLMTLTSVGLFDEFKVYQLVSHQYMHNPNSLGHLFFNMLFLFFVGRELEQRWGSKNFFIAYTASGAFAGLLEILMQSNNIGVIGASGSVMGMICAFALYYPNRVIHIYLLFPVKIKYLFAALIIYDLYSALTMPTNNIANFAHLGGAIIGYLYVVYYEKNHNSYDWQDNRRKSYTQTTNYFDKIKKLFDDKTTSKTKFKSTEKTEYSSEKVQFYRSEVDRLLDKINDVGYLKLSDEERKKLEEASDYLKRYDSN